MKASTWNKTEVVERLELAIRLRSTGWVVSVACILVVHSMSGFALDITHYILLAIAVLVYDLLAVAYMKAVNRGAGRAPVSPALVLGIFGALDLTALGVVIYWTGGVESPFVLMLFFYLVGASVVFSPLVSYFVATIANLVLIAIEFLPDPGVNLGGNAFISGGGFTGLLVTRRYGTLEIPEIAILLLVSGMSYLVVYTVTYITSRLNRKQLEFGALVREQEKTLAQLTVLQQIGTEISALADLNTVLDLVVMKARELFSTDSAYLALREEGTDDIVVTVTCGENSEIFNGVRIGPGQAMGGIVMVTGKPVIVADYTIDPRLEGRQLELALQANIKSGMAVPLTIGHCTIGVLYVFNHEITDFDAQDAEVLLALANQAAIAIENARLYTDLRKAALTDSLTGLHNSRFLQERLQSEMARAARYGGKLALLMGDCDSMKEVNDQFGHQVGDRLLIQLGQIIREEVRDSDIVARYGGDEFVVLLPESDAVDAAQAAERIRCKVESTPLRTNDTEVLITISFGVAVYPGEATDAEDMLRKADEALYQAKRLGKNKVCTMEPLPG